MLIALGAGAAPHRASKSGQGDAGRGGARVGAESHSLATISPSLHDHANAEVHEIVTQIEKDAREQKITIIVLLTLAVLGTAIMFYGLATDSEALPIFGFVIAMPMTLALMFNVGAYFIFPRQSPPQ